MLIRTACKFLHMARNASTQAKPHIYELRIYNIYPKDIRSFIELSTKWMHLRKAKSPLVGFWLSELGGINDAVHIWEYESLSDRARVRKELGQEQEWQTNYIAKAGPMWHRQDNALLTLKQGAQLNTNIQPGGVYELQTLPKDAQCGSVPNGTTVIGDFKTVFGPLDKSFRLLHHSDIDDAVSSSGESLKGVTADDVHTRLLSPAPWSTLQ